MGPIVKLQGPGEEDPALAAEGLQIVARQFLPLQTGAGRRCLAPLSAGQAAAESFRPGAWRGIPFR